MKKTTFLALLLTLAACDSKSSEPKEPAAPEVKVPGKKEVAKEVATGVKDVLSNKGPKWKVDYTGDLKGSVEGGILTAMAIGSNTTAVGAAMTPDKKGKAKQGLRLTIANAKGDKPHPMFNLTLADGTKCKPSGAPSNLKLLDPAGKTFHAELSGKLKCAGDKNVEFTAVLEK